MVVGAWFCLAAIAVEPGGFGRVRSPIEKFETLLPGVVRQSFGDGGAANAVTLKKFNRLAEGMTGWFRTASKCGLHASVGAAK